VLLLLGIHVVGTAGFYLIEGWALFDAFYMTVITISTVGFTEVHPLTLPGRVFSILLIAVGVGGMMYGMTVIFQLLIEGRLRDLMGKYKMKRGIRTMKNHYIVCGYGRVGRHVTDALRHRGELAVVVEKQSEYLDELQSRMIPFVPGDATDDKVVEAAGLAHAQAIVLALAHEADNVFVALTARQTNPGIRIVARCDEESAYRKLKVAGVDAIIRPHQIGGEAMALAASEPDVVGYVGMAGDSDQAPLRVDELLVEPGSHLCGVRVADLTLEREFDVILVAVRHGDGRLSYRPAGAIEVAAGDAIIVIGEVDKLSLLQRLVKTPAPENLQTAAVSPQA
jgi:voltage-gated potassium channel